MPENIPKMVCFGQYASYQFNCKFCDELRECRETTIAKRQSANKQSTKRTKKYKNNISNNRNRLGVGVGGWQE